MAEKSDKLKTFLGIDDLKSGGIGSFVVSLFAELLGTLFIILLGCGSALNLSVECSDQVSLKFISFIKFGRGQICLPRPLGQGHS
jgi:hypothetical protein